MYKIVAYIPVEAEEDELFETLEEVNEVIDSLNLMQPENIYIPVDLDKDNHLIEGNNNYGNSNNYL